MNFADRKKGCRRWGSLEKRLAAYAVAGGAALVAGSEAKADIIWSGPQNISVGVNQTVNIDLNGDGQNDFSFIQNGNNSLVLNCVLSGDKSVPDSGGSYVANLAFGTVIDGSQTYSQNLNLLTNNGAKIKPVFSGNFYNTHGYIGVEFTDLSSQNHFGWIGFTGGPASGQPTGTITDWAYESDPGDPITAGETTPEPTSLALLALGAAGVAVWRGRKALASRPTA
jgi:hypothetical protein